MEDNSSTSTISGFKKMYGEVKDSLDPIIMSSIEALIEKTYDALETDNERKKLFGETIMKSVELMQNPNFSKEDLENFTNEALSDSKLDDIILSCLEGQLDTDGESTKVLAEDVKEKSVSAEGDGKLFTKQSISSTLCKLKPKGDAMNMNNPSLSARLERLEESSKMISHTKVKKVIKNVSSSNPFVQRVSTATTTGLPKYMFSPRAGQMKGCVSSNKTVKIETMVANKRAMEAKKEKETANKQRVDAATDTGDDKVGDKVNKNVDCEANKKRVEPDATDTANITITKHTQHWTVGNFNKKMSMNNGKSIDSMFFSILVNGKTKTDWSLMLYPNGDKERVTGNLSLYLTCRNRRGLNMSLEFKFLVLDSEGKAAAAPSKSGSISSDMLSTNSSWGWESFVKQKDLRSNNLLVNNKLTICCEITLKQSSPQAKEDVKEETALEDDRDIDALVDFVGELCVESKKKKGKKSPHAKVPMEQAEVEASDSSSEDEETMELGNCDKSNVKAVEVPVVEDSDDFQVVTRRRRKNSSTNLSSSPSVKEVKSSKSKSKQKSSANSKKQSKKEVKNKDDVKIEKVVKKSPVNDKLTSICLDTKESLEELLKTKNLLEENLGRLNQLFSIKTDAVGQLKEDKSKKLEQLARGQEQLRLQKQTLETKIQEQRLILDKLESDVESVDAQLKRGVEKEARLKIYLDMNIADASSQLSRLGKEKDDLEARLDQVENKLRGNRRKERLLNIHNQILRLQTNLECPICAETAQSPIYQCKEVHNIHMRI